MTFPWWRRAQLGAVKVTNRFKGVDLKRSAVTSAKLVSTFTTFAGMKYPIAIRDKKVGHVRMKAPRCSDCVQLLLITACYHYNRVKRCSVVTCWPVAACTRTVCLRYLDAVQSRGSSRSEEIIWSWSPRNTIWSKEIFTQWVWGRCVCLHVSESDVISRLI